MNDTVCVYTNDTAFQILSAIEPLTVRYDGDTSKYYVRYENCELVKEGKLIECRGRGETINEACVNYMGIINFATMTFKNSRQTFRLMFMKAQ